MRMLVTGGGGFLGSTLITGLPERMEAVSLDHGRSYDALRGMVRAKVRWLRGDIDDPRAVQEAMRGIDVLVHLAGVSGERRCVADPLRSTLSNVYATHVLCGEARRASVKRLVYASSYHAYSTFRARPCPIGETDTLGTDTLYGAQKVVSERIVAEAGIPYAILRVSALYGFGTGFGSQWEGLVGRWATAGLAGKPIDVFGTGEQQIDMVHVDDVAAAICRLLDAPQAWNQVYNCGGGEPVRILDLARIVERVFRDELGRSITITMKPAPPGKVWPDKWLAVDKLKHALNGFPDTPLEEGVARTLRAFAQSHGRTS